MGQTAILQKRDTVTQDLRLFHVLGRNNQDLVFLRELDVFPDLAFIDNVETCCWLVQRDDLGVAKKCNRD